MVSLNLERINSNSPYAVTALRDSMCFLPVCYGLWCDLLCKQSMRNRLFEFWFHSSPRKSDFAFMSADIRDADGIQNYAAIIIRLDNPNLKSIVAEFTETIQMLSQKPE